MVPARPGNGQCRADFLKPDPTIDWNDERPAAVREALTSGSWVDSGQRWHLSTYGHTREAALGVTQEAIIGYLEAGRGEGKR
jgi:hypothetical protein